MENLIRWLEKECYVDNNAFCIDCDMSFMKTSAHNEHNTLLYTRFGGLPTSDILKIVRHIHSKAFDKGTKEAQYNPGNYGLCLQEKED